MNEIIDITPEGCKTPEGGKRVAEAQTAWDSAAHALANAAIEFFDTYEDNMRGRFLGDAGFGEDLHQIRALIGALRRKQDTFLNAVAGR